MARTARITPTPKPLTLTKSELSILPRLQAEVQQIDQELARLQQLRQERGSEAAAVLAEIETRLGLDAGTFDRGEYAVNWETGTLIRQDTNGAGPGE